LDRRERRTEKNIICYSIFLLCLFSITLHGEHLFQSTPDQDSEGFRGALNIRIHRSGEGLHPPAELLLIDPQKRKTGSDPKLQVSFSEIPNSSYENESIDDAVSGAPGPVTKILDIRNPIDGVYVLKIIGIGSGKYSLEIRAYDFQMEFVDAKFIDIEIGNHGEHLFTIEYYSEKNSDFKVIPPASIKKKIETQNFYWILVLS
jgi:hypothetical protein